MGSRTVSTFAVWRCDAFRPDEGVEARVLSAGSAHVAAGLFESADPRGPACGGLRREYSKGSKS